MKKNNSGTILLLPLILIVVIISLGVFLYTQRPTTAPSQNQTSDWKIYTDQKLGFSFKYPNWDPPGDKYTKPDAGQPVFTVTDRPNFDSKSLSICKTYNEDLCLIPGANWGQSKEIEELMIAGKSATSFFVSTKNAVGGNIIIHIIQFNSPRVEIALSVDGAGLEGDFQNILSTFKFTN